MPRRGQRHSAESRAKMRASLTVERRAAISAAQKGRPKSIEHRAKIGAVRKGKPLSAEQRAKLRAAITKHGHNARGKRTPTHLTWHAMIDRCTNPRATSFKHYGGRGITMCDRWRDFTQFLADMGERPAGTSIDRIDNDAGYFPGNCRWSSPKEQRANRCPRKTEAA